MSPEMILQYIHAYSESDTRIQSTTIAWELCCTSFSLAFLRSIHEILMKYTRLSFQINCTFHKISIFLRSVSHCSEDCYANRLNYDWVNIL